MKHFLFLVSFVFAVLFLALLNKKNHTAQGQTQKLKVFTSTSFASNFGPGPLLKAEFEKSCQCEVDFVEGSDSSIIIQRLKVEGESLGIDMIIGFDQFEIETAQKSIDWKTLKFDTKDFEKVIAQDFANEFFVPYDWGLLSFVGKKGLPEIKTLRDLMSPDFHKKFALQDPRTSSPGLQFLSWLTKEEFTLQEMSQVIDQAYSIAPSWSSAYSLMTRGQVDYVFSYVTSPLYHQLIEKNNNYQAFKLSEPLPIQVEYFGITEFCQNCELAEKFAQYLVSREGQKIIMEKNFMFPVLPEVRKGTPFDIVDHFLFEKNNQFKPVQALQRWSQARRGNFSE